MCDIFKDPFTALLARGHAFWSLPWRPARETNFSLRLRCWKQLPHKGDEDSWLPIHIWTLNGSVVEQLQARDTEYTLVSLLPTPTSFCPWFCISSSVSSLTPLQSLLCRFPWSPCCHCYPVPLCWLSSPVDTCSLLPPYKICFLPWH